MYAPPRTPSIQRAARERLEEDLRFAARCVCPIGHSTIPRLMISALDCKCLHSDERKSLDTILFTL